jgi:hypothetical protein
MKSSKVTDGLKEDARMQTYSCGWGEMQEHEALELHWLSVF